MATALIGWEQRCRTCTTIGRGDLAHPGLDLLRQHVLARRLAEYERGAAYHIREVSNMTLSYPDPTLTCQRLAPRALTGGLLSVGNSFGMHVFCMASTWPTYQK